MLRKLKEGKTPTGFLEPLARVCSLLPFLMFVSLSPIIIFLFVPVSSPLFCPFWAPSSSSSSHFLPLSPLSFSLASPAHHPSDFSPLTSASTPRGELSWDLYQLTWDFPGEARLPP